MEKLMIRMIPIQSCLKTTTNRGFLFDLILKWCIIKSMKKKEIFND